MFPMFVCLFSEPEAGGGEVGFPPVFFAFVLCVFVCFVVCVCVCVCCFFLGGWVSR